jgi:hypothetical protein
MHAPRPERPQNGETAGGFPLRRLASIVVMGERSGGADTNPKMLNQSR